MTPRVVVPFSRARLSHLHTRLAPCMWCGRHRERKAKHLALSRRRGSSRFFKVMKLTQIQRHALNLQADRTALVVVRG